MLERYLTVGEVVGVTILVRCEATDNPPWRSSILLNPDR